MASDKASVVWGADDPLGWQLLRVRSRSRSFRPWRWLLSMLMLFCCAAVGRSQTTINISNAVETPGIDRPGINLGGLGGYGSQQIFKSLNYVNGGDFPGTYAATTYQCKGGTNSTWFNDITDNNGYPANYWAGATFTAINSANGTSYGSGVITASTSNAGGSGTTFTLSPAISSPCNPAQGDVLIVRLNAPSTQLTPYQVLNNHICPQATWDAGDTAPTSGNTQHSLEMPNGCGLTFYIDATVSNRTNTNPGLASQQVNFININGAYTASFKAKCLGGGCSVNFSLLRFGGTTFVANTTVSPSTGGPGAGWTTYTYPFTGSENGTQNGSIGYSFTCTGTCLLQDADVIEGSTLPGNTTVFRDGVVAELQKIHPGSLRYMDSSQWCSDVADEIATTGNRRWCGSSDYGPGAGQPIGYADVLALANFIGSDVLISVGQLNQPADWNLLINWLNSSGWTSTYAATGHTIYLEDGNEAWNSGVGATLYFGNGTAYGYTLGPNMAAARAASGYNPSVIKLVGDGWVAGSQGYGPFGWIHNALGVAQGTPNGLPDFMDDAPYTLNYLGNFDTSGGNVATTGAPFVDEFAEIANIDSVPTPPLYTQSMLLNQQYAKANFGVNTLVYEVNMSTLSGVPANELQLDQIGASVGSALVESEHVLLMQRDSMVSGPIHVFTLAEPYTGYSCSGCGGGSVIPLWGTNLYMATGPGQAVGSASADRPLNIALSVINNAIGANNNLMSITQTGTPTYNYPGGQRQGGSNSISPNAAVPYVNCFSYSNGASAWTTLCFNNNLTAAESVTLAGAGAPTGSVSETVFPGSSNVITDHNENTFLGAGSIAPVVNYPNATTTSGTSYSIPPASFIALTYTTGGVQIPSALGTPNISLATGSYSGIQTVGINFPAGSTGCIGINSLPTALVPGKCGPGGTTYTGPITVSTSETIYAIATQAGFVNSALATATYTLTTASTVATPTFSPGGGTYATTQSVSIGDTTPGATLYYTTNGSTPTTSSSVYGGPVTVSASETLAAIAVKSGSTTSSVATAGYTISAVATGGGSGSPTVATSCYQGSAASSLTTGPINTTGASAIAIVVASFNNILTVTDSLGNGNAIGLAPANANSPSNQIFYWQNPTVGGAHTFTVNGSGGLYASACVFVISGVTGTYSGAQSANTAGYGDSSCHASLTPGSGPQVIIAGFGVYTPSGTPTLDSGFTVPAYQPGAGGSAFGEAAGYLIQPSGTTISPTWNWGNASSTPSCVMAAFGGGSGVTATAATPTFSPAAGTYATPQSVSIGDATPGTTLYYTTNGTMPTTSSSIYAGPITVSATETLAAIAVEAGYTTSPSNAAIYTISTALPAPSFSPGAGTYTTAQSVSLADATPGTTIYYTTNGTTPTTSSSVYGGPITVSASETLQAIAVKSGSTNSAASMSAYTINTVVTGGGGPSVATSCYQGSGASSLTTGPIDTTGANAIALVIASFNNILTVTDNMGNGNAVSLPAASGNSPNNQIFYWQTPTVGGGHTFTVNGSHGLYASACVFVMSGVSGTYSGAQSASSAGYASSTCQAGAITPGTGPQIIITGFGVYTPSGTPTLDSGYTVAASQPGAAGSAFGEAAGYLIQPSGATTNPQWNWGNAASSPGCVIAAFGGGTGASATQTAATPAFSIAAGTYTTAQSVTISDATPGTTIYYTTDGSTPTTSSSIYGEAITVSASQTLQALAVETGYATSAVAAAGYTINTSTTGKSYISLATGQFAASAFYLNGGATITPDGALQVVDGGYGEGRSAWFNTPVPVGKFTTDFTFQLPYANGDGMTFTLQGQGPDALGGPGGYLGYRGITSSVAIKFDLYNNGGEGIDSTGLYIGGAAPTVPAIALSKTGIDLHSGHIFAAHLVYDGTNLTMTLTDVVTAASAVEVFPVDIPGAVGGSTAYVGFTGGTGGVASIQNVLTWTYSTD